MRHVVDARRGLPSASLFTIFVPNQAGDMVDKPAVIAVARPTALAVARNGGGKCAFIVIPHG
jgi:hypothetical protein